MTPALLSAALLLLLLPGAPAQSKPPAQNIYPPPIYPTLFTVLVSNSVTNAPNKTFGADVPFRGILLGGLSTLQDYKSGFKFSYTEDKNYGPFLESVNGLAGNPSDRTYWELKVKKSNKQIITPDVGIGCYIPSAGDTIILNFNKY